MLETIIFAAPIAVILLVMMHPDTARYTIETQNPVAPGAGFRSTAYHNGKPVATCYHKDNATSRRLALAAGRHHVEGRPIA